MTVAEHCPMVMEPYYLGCASTEDRPTVINQIRSHQMLHGCNQHTAGLLIGDLCLLSAVDAPTVAAAIESCVTAGDHLPDWQYHIVYEIFGALAGATPGSDHETLRLLHAAMQNCRERWDLPRADWHPAVPSTTLDARGFGWSEP